LHFPQNGNFILTEKLVFTNCVCCVCQSLTMTPEARMEATMQHEITRLTSENLVSCEVV